MFKSLMLSVLCCLSVNASANGNGGTWLDATRVVYNQGDTSRSVKVTNTSDDIPYLIRTWVTRIDNIENNQLAKDWIVTPPVYRLNEKSAVQLKITMLNDAELPKNKESVFYLNVLSIPGVSSDNKQAAEGSLDGKVVIALNTKIKLFYRPQGISDEDVSSAFNKITFTSQGDNVSINNPTPFYMNFAELKINGVEHKIPQQMVAPFSSFTLTAKSQPEKVTYRLINDFGGETSVKEINLKG